MIEPLIINAWNKPYEKSDHNLLFLVYLFISIPYLLSEQFRGLNQLRMIRDLLLLGNFAVFVAMQNDFPVIISHVANELVHILTVEVILFRRILWPENMYNSLAFFWVILYLNFKLSTQLNLNIGNPYHQRHFIHFQDIVNFPGFGIDFFHHCQSHWHDVLNWWTSSWIVVVCSVILVCLSIHFEHTQFPFE